MSPTPIGAATQALLRRFRSQRPVRGGSLLLTIFGDAIAPRGGVVTLGSLIQLAQPFGLTERLVRTSVARLAQDGWLVARRDGRRSEYRLTPGGQQRFAEATRRIYGKSPVTWNGQWTLLLLPPPAGKRRDGLRDELRWLGFGQVSPGVFAHPSGDLSEIREWLRNLDSPRDAQDATLLKSSSEELTADRRLVAAGWDLGELARRYRRFVDTFTPIESAVSSSAAKSTSSPSGSFSSRSSSSAPFSPTSSSSTPSFEAAFVVRTLLIHEYRKIHLQDPLLPPALLPDDWIGSRAYDLCSSLYARVFNSAEAFLSDTASTLDESLPAAAPSAYERFGGIR